MSRALALPGWPGCHEASRVVGEDASAKPGPATGAGFPLTQWTLVRRHFADGAEGTPEALEELWRLYRAPVYTYFRGACKLSAADAEDLATDLALRLPKLLRALLRREPPWRGRFRDFLRACARNAVCTWHRKRRRELPMADLPEGVEAALPSDTSCDSMDHHFDREWALAAVRKAGEALADEYRRTGKEQDYRVLQPWLITPPPAGQHECMAKRLGITPSACRQRLAQIRKSFRRHVHAAVLPTLQDPSELENELRHLIAVWLSQPTPAAPAPDATCN